MARINPNQALEDVMKFRRADDATNNFIYIAGKWYVPVILASRAVGRFALINKNGSNYDKHQEQLDQDRNLGEARLNKSLGENYDGHQDQLTKDRSRGDLTKTKNINTGNKDIISIVDLDWHEDGSDRYFERLDLPFVPREVEYTMDSNFVGIASMGRNNPHYHFTGSEDTLEFTIDWFSDNLNREDVIFRCRWLESMTKNDSYIGRPHRIAIFWGNNNRLWSNDTWLLTKAPYKLTQFNRGYVDPDTGNYVSTHLLPQQAYQTCTFKRITTTNRTAQAIMGKLGIPNSSTPRIS